MTIFTVIIEKAGKLKAVIATTDAKEAKAVFKAATGKDCDAIHLFDSRNGKRSNKFTRSTAPTRRVKVVPSALIAEIDAPVEKEPDQETEPETAEAGDGEAPDFNEPGDE